MRHAPVVCVAAGFVFALHSSGARSASVRSGWKSLALVTPEGRPSPPRKYAELARICRDLTNQAVSYPERGRLAGLLEGTSHPSAVRALSSAILERGSRRAIAPLRISCARSLRWAASRGDHQALRALWKALVDPSNDYTSGDAIAKCLLDARGAGEVLSRAMRLTLGPFSEDEDSAPLRLALKRVTSEVEPYHVGWGNTVEAASASCATATGQALRRSSDSTFIAILQQNGPGDPSRFLQIGWRDEIPQILAAMRQGLHARGPEARGAFVKWLHEAANGRRGRLVVEGLTARGVSELGKLLDQLDEPERELLLAVLEKTCHGRAADVLAGKVDLFDVLLEEAQEELDRAKAWGNWYHAQGERLAGPPPPLAWCQLRFETGGDGPHPHVEALKALNGYPEPVVRLVAYGSWPGIAAWERVVPLRERIEEQVGQLSLGEEAGRELFRKTLDLRIHLATPEERPLLAAEMVDRCSSAPPQYLADRLADISGWSFATSDRAFPVKVAEWIVSLAERAARERLPVRKRRLTAALGNITPEELAPEGRLLRHLVRERNSRSFTSEAEKEAYMAQYRKKRMQLKEARVTPEAAAAWRAWLERFRKLPVFRPAESRAGGVAP